MKHYDLKFEVHHLRFLGLDRRLSENALGYFYNPQENIIIKFNVLDNLKALRLFSNLVHHVSLTSRHDKFLKVYCIFELLGGKPDTSWRAIRVSISHSTKKITEKKLVDYLLSNFGELKISFKTYNQNKIFYDALTELVDATYFEILKNLHNPTTIQNECAQEIIDVLTSFRERHLNRTNRSRLYFYEDLERKLRQKIPYGYSAGRILYLLGEYSQN